MEGLTKICTRCKNERLLSQFRKKSKSDKLREWCGDCEKEDNLNRYYRNHEAVLKKHQEYRNNNKEKIKERAKIARVKYNHSAYSNVKRREYRDKVTNAYVRGMLRSKGIPNESITDEMVETQRVVILVERIEYVLRDLGIKVCPECKEKKSIDDFYDQNHYWKGQKVKGKRGFCKVCDLKRSKENRKRK